MNASFWKTDEVGPRHALFVMAVLLVLRAWSFANPIVDVDEPQFAGFAHALLDGGVPFVSSVDTKPLGVYWFFAAIFAIFGRHSMEAVHLATAFWVGLTSLFCFRIGRRLYSAGAGFWAALFYAIFSTTFVPKFIGTSIAVLMMLPLTMSIDMLLRWEERGRRRDLLFSGLLWGCACLFKYQAGINLLAVGFYLLVFRPLILGQGFRGVRVREYALFVAGGFAVGGLFALYLHLAGAWDAFVFWSLKGSAAYVQKGASQTSLLSALPVRGGAFVASGFLVWYFATRKIVQASGQLLRSSGEVCCGEWLVIVWLAFSFAGVFAGGKLYGHYFYQVMPQLCVLAGGWAVVFLANSARWATWRRRAAISLFVAAMAVPAMGFTAARLSADRIYAATGEENPKSYIRVSDYVRGRTGPEDKIFVWGFATSIYFYSERSAASRFLWSDWLTGRVSGTPSAKDPNFDTSAFIVPESWEMFFEDMENSRPAYFLDTSPGNHHDYGKYPVGRFPRLAKFLSDNYEFETSVDGIDVYRRVNP